MPGYLFVGNEKEINLEGFVSKASLEFSIWNLDLRFDMHDTWKANTDIADVKGKTFLNNIFHAVARTPDAKLV